MQRRLVNFWSRCVLKYDMKQNACKNSKTIRLKFSLQITNPQLKFDN